jgi:hypothetical protein
MGDERQAAYQRSPSPKVVRRGGGFGVIPPVLPFLLRWPRLALLIRRILDEHGDERARIRPDSGFTGYKPVDVDASTAALASLPRRPR